MPSDLHVTFRLSKRAGTSLQDVAEVHGVSHNLMARTLVLASLDKPHREELDEQLQALRQELAEQKELIRALSEELRSFHAEFHQALKRTIERSGQSDGSNRRSP